MSYIRENVFVKKKSLPIFILGGGSNVFVSDDGFSGLILKINLKGRQLISENENFVTLKVGAGEVLDEIIEWVVLDGWRGMENLSFVPGTIGGATYMNAGCYGQEIAEVINSVTALDLNTSEITLIPEESCGFGYRKSRFNENDKNRFVILEVELILKKNGVFNL